MVCLEKKTIMGQCSNYSYYLIYAQETFRFFHLTNLNSFFFNFRVACVGFPT